MLHQRSKIMDEITKPNYAKPQYFNRRISVKNGGQIKANKVVRSATRNITVNNAKHTTKVNRETLKRIAQYMEEERMMRQAQEVQGVIGRFL